MSTATSGLPVRAASGSSTARAVTSGCSRCPRRMSATSIGAGITGQTYISPPRLPCTGSISELQGIGRATWGRSVWPPRRLRVDAELAVVQGLVHAAAYPQFLVSPGICHASAVQNQDPMGSQDCDPGRGDRAHRSARLADLPLAPCIQRVIHGRLKPDLLVVVLAVD